MYRGYRGTSVPPGLYRAASVGNVSRSVAGGSGGRLPSYCPAHGQYYGYSTPSVVSSISTQRRSAVPTYSTYSSTRYLDPLPTRHFGTRLAGRGYASIISRPEIYEETYGVSHLPGYGRDGFSAYKYADATIDDSEDLVNYSNKRDNQVLRNVEKMIANAYNPVPVTTKTFVRASSVPPQLHRSSNNMTRYNRIGQAALARRPGATVAVKRGDNSTFYRSATPRVQVHYEPVTQGSRLLSAQERMLGREALDLSSPSGTVALRLRLHDLQNGLDKHGAMLGRYSGSGPDALEIEADAEVRRIKTNQALRAKSVV